MALAHEDLFSLNNKVSLVTGAARGLGRSMAIGLAEAGSDLMLVDVLDDRLKQTSVEVSEKTGRHVAYRVADLGETESLSVFLLRTSQRRCGKRKKNVNGSNRASPSGVRAHRMTSSEQSSTWCHPPRTTSPVG